jgi:short chain dehydrogenase
MFAYKGSTAMITGASKGLGAAFAKELAGRGMNLVLIARSIDTLQDLADSLGAQYGVSCVALRADLAASDAGPLSMAICTGSAEESLRVRLLSMPQDIQAAAISTAPQSREALPSHDSSAAPARMANAPSSNLLSTFSRKSSHAMPIVAKPSRLSSNEAPAASVRANPNIRNKGPRMPACRDDGGEPRHIRMAKGSLHRRKLQRATR